MLTFDCRHSYPAGFELEARFQSAQGVTALFGPSGSGKSTVLSILAGVLRPARGHIRLAGEVLLDTAAGIRVAPERRGIGCVFQDQLLFPHLSVERNLRYGMSRRPARRIDFQRLVAVLELGDLLERPPRTLSGGQKQRVALGRAILRGPRLLLMDEPLAALDEEVKARILDYLERSFREWAIPTLFVSHDQSDVRRLAHQVVVLENGRVIDSGPASPTLDRAVLTRMKCHTGPVNLLRVADVRQVGGHWEGRIGEQRIHLAAGASSPGSSAHVRFLPQDVALSRSDVPGLSVRNQLHGRVREVVALGERVFVAVDVGQFLWAEVTAEAVRELDLRPDVLVTCLVKTSAVHRVG